LEIIGEPKGEPLLANTQSRGASAHLFAGPDQAIAHFRGDNFVCLPADYVVGLMHVAQLHWQREMHARTHLKLGRGIIDSSWRVVAVMRFSGGASEKEGEDDGLCGGSEPPPMLWSLTLNEMVVHRCVRTSTRSSNLLQIGQLYLFMCDNSQSDVDTVTKSDVDNFKSDVT